MPQHQSRTIVIGNSPVLRQNHIREESLTLGQRMAILQPVRAAFRRIVALRIVLSIGRDLYIECLALRHELAVLRRLGWTLSPDRLIWVCLRRWWVGWKKALVLVQRPRSPAGIVKNGSEDVGAVD